ncbi:MAG: T9SS type A sorting domain-containing protein, partial [Flavobacteriales bacterium]
PNNQLSATTIASNSFGGVTSGLTVMTFYRVSQPIAVTGIELVISNTNPANTEAGGYVIGQLLDSAGVLSAGANLPPPLLASDPIDITTAMVSAGVVNIPLNDGTPYMLAPGDYYLAVTLVGVDGSGAVKRIVVRDDLTVPQPAWASAIHFSTAPQGGQARTYRNGNAFAIRMKVVGNVGVDELQASAGMLYPNPTNGLLTFHDGQPGKREAAVFDALGQRVATAIGQGPLTIDLSPFADGMYTVRINAGNAMRTERVMLAR